MEVNYLAVILAALSAFFLGFLWYTVIFAKSWQKEVGMPDDIHKKKNQQTGLARFLAGSLALETVMAFNLAIFIGKNSDWLYGLGVGVAFGLGFIGLALGVNYMFEGKSFKLWLINAGYNTVVFAAMGLIIGAL